MFSPFFVALILVVLGIKMSDETPINTAQVVETAGDDDSPKLLVHQKISDLQSENARITQQNEDYRKEIDELEEVVQKADELTRLSEDLKRRLGELERDVVDLLRGQAELERGKRDFMKNWEEIEEMDKATHAELNAKTIEIHLLRAYIRKLEADAISLRCELDEKEEEIQSMKRELAVVLERNKALKKSMGGLEEMAEQLKDKISALEIGLADKKKVITEPEAKEKKIA